MKNILESIFQRLREQVPELNFIDVDLGQLQLQNPPVDFPCALVDVSNIQYASGGQGVQTAVCSINLTLGFMEYGPSDVDSADHLRQQALAHYDILHSACAALHGFGTALFSPLNRTALRRGNETYPRHYVITFTTQYTDRLGTGDGSGYTRLTDVPAKIAATGKRPDR